MIFISFVLILTSCEKSQVKNLQGNWRECVNDSFVIDYTIKNDTIKVKFCDLDWCHTIPYIINDSSYLCKDSSDCIYYDERGGNMYKDLLIFKLLSWSDSIAEITHDNGRSVRFIKLKRFQNVLPNKIIFDIDFKSTGNAVNKKIGLGEGDYELNIDGRYRFYSFEKLYTGNISDTLLSELINNYNLVDTLDKRFIKHSFEIHQIKQDYKLLFYFENRIEQFDITDKQPYQFNRLSYTFEKIWYEILKKSGHKIQ